MAQGSGKLNKAGGGKSSHKRGKAAVAAKKKKVSKGRRHHRPRRTHAVASLRAESDIAKAINRKNEAIISAKAVGEGTRFFLGDVTAAGSKELKAQMQTRNKKETKAEKMTDRVKEQLRKLGRDVK